MPNKKIVIDTNVLVSFVTDRDPKQQDQAAQLFQEAVSLKKSILCPQNVVTEFVYVLDRVYKTSLDKIQTMVSDLIGLPGVTIIHTVNFQKLMDLWPRYISDFGDAIVASVGRETKNAVIATFDKKFVTALKGLGFGVFMDE